MIPMLVSRALQWLPVVPEHILQSNYGPRYAAQPWQGGLTKLLCCQNSSRP